MNAPETVVFTVEMPPALAAKVDQLAVRMAGSRGSVIKDALVALIDQEDAFDQLTRDAMLGVRAGEVVDHAQVQNWVDGLTDASAVATPVR